MVVHSNGELFGPTELPDSAWKQRFRRRLLTWFHHNARAMPWRDHPRPYYVWVSEIMLQQTQVATVIPYFERFIKRFPDVSALAAAEEADVLRLWEGLGYYRRARQLHKAAQVIMEQHSGDFPQSREAVHALPGVGRYTAGAILSIAFGTREPILEANTKRVLSRLLLYRGDPEKASGQQLLWRFAEDLLPRKNVGTFNQALMELGSEICSPRTPACQVCPVATLCPTHKYGLQDQIPARKRKPGVENVDEAVIVVRRGPCVLLRQRSEKERWAGLWDFPRFPLANCEAPPTCEQMAELICAATGLETTPTRLLTTLKHGVTRFRITLYCYEANYQNGVDRIIQPTAWLRVDEMKNFPLSVTGRKISQLVNT